MGGGEWGEGVHPAYKMVYLLSDCSLAGEVWLSGSMETRTSHSPIGKFLIWWLMKGSAPGRLCQSSSSAESPFNVSPFRITFSSCFWSRLLLLFVGWFAGWLWLLLLLEIPLYYSYKFEALRFFMSYFIFSRFDHLDLYCECWPLTVGITSI